MPDYHSAYLFYDALFLAVWIALFVLRNDLRVPMIIYSLLVAPLGPGSEAWYLRDYWKPLTITGTDVGIEDVLFAFAIGGIALAIMFSGIIFLALFVTIYQIMQRVYPGLLEAWCTGCNPSGVRPLGWNIEEYLWDSAWGILGGILYPSVAGLATSRRAPDLF
jgi:hypothetical protein